MSLSYLFATAFSTGLLTNVDIKRSTTNIRIKNMTILPNNLYFGSGIKQSSGIKTTRRNIAVVITGIAKILTILSERDPQVELSTPFCI